MRSCGTVDKAGPSRSNLCPTGELCEDMATSDSEELIENRRRLLAEIRSCFRVLSIHSRLCGNESPRTRRIISQANSSQSLHSLAIEKSTDINCPCTSRGASTADEVQSCLLYNQLIVGPFFADGRVSPTPVDYQHLQTEQGEPRSENIRQVSMGNSTLQLKPKEDLSKSDVVKVVEWLYRDHPGAVWRAASRDAMTVGEDSNSLIYGEVSFVAFAKLSETYFPQSSTSLSTKTKKSQASASNSDGTSVGFNFYDLGCGGGRCVFMASLLNKNCAKACGIEIVPGMHEMNQVLLKLFKKEVQPNLHPVKQAQELVFVLGDFLQIDWSDADVIFSNATCFEDPLFHKFEDMATKCLKPGAIVISVARYFTNLASWDLLEQKERRMSWAPAMVNVYRKTSSRIDSCEQASTSSTKTDDFSDRQPSG